MATQSTELQVVMGIRHYEPGTLPGDRARPKPIRRRRLDAEKHDRVSAEQWAGEQSRTVLRIAAILMTLFFFYASAIPLKFSAPDFSERLATMVASTPWERGRLFDWTANILAFIPLGFVWAGTCYSPLSGRAARHVAAMRSATGCLILACLAEILQLWLPLRVPSFRDIVALEAGAIIGCTLWMVVGPHTPVWNFTTLRRMSRQERHRYSAYKWPALFGFLFFSLFAMNALAGPSDWFEIYRHRAFLSRGSDIAARFASATPLLVSVAAAAGIWTFCRLCELIVSRYSATAPRRTIDPRLEPAIVQLASASGFDQESRSATRDHPEPVIRRAA